MPKVKQLEAGRAEILAQGVWLQSTVILLLCVAPFFFFFLGLHLRHMEVPRLGVKLEL